MASSVAQVHILWDESAELTNATSGFDTAAAIMSVATSFGAIRAFKLYVDPDKSRAFTPKLKSELQASGVSVLSVAADGRSGGASKMMLADAFVNALYQSSQTPSVTVIVTADPDILYGLSLMKAQGSHVVLLCPPDSHANLARFSFSQLHVLEKQKPRGTNIRVGHSGVDDEPYLNTRIPGSFRNQDVDSRFEEGSISPPSSRSESPHSLRGRRFQRDEISVNSALSKGKGKVSYCTPSPSSSLDGKRRSSHSRDSTSTLSPRSQRSDFAMVNVSEGRSAVEPTSESPSDFVSITHQLSTKASSTLPASTAVVTEDGPGDTITMNGTPRGSHIVAPSPVAVAHMHLGTIPAKPTGMATTISQNSTFSASSPASYDFTPKPSASPLVPNPLLPLRPAGPPELTPKPANPPLLLRPMGVPTASAMSSGVSNTPPSSTSISAPPRPTSAPMPAPTNARTQTHPPPIPSRFRLLVELLQQHWASGGFAVERSGLYPLLKNKEPNFLEVCEITGTKGRIARYLQDAYVTGMIVSAEGDVVLHPDLRPRTSDDGQP